MAALKKSHRFIITGTSSAVLYFLLTLFLLKINIRPAVATATSFIFIFLITYLAQKRWAFENTSHHGKVFPRYALTQFFCMIASSVAAEASSFILSTSDIFMVAFIATLVSGGLSYWLSSRWVFVDRQ